MDILEKTLGWGFLVGLIHFVVVGALYLNPFVDRLYKKVYLDHPGVRKWPSMKQYVAWMFLGTQVEVFFLAGAYFYLAPRLALGPMATALATWIIFAAIRVYPRFFNMWIQSSYPRPLLAVELVNGTLGTLVVTASLALLAA